MAKHQIIYTSCKKGIEGTNDGQQVFSYDEGFENYKSTDVVKLFGYKVPLKSGETMTEELALTMPKAFSYRPLKNGMTAIVLNTYLGRDYMGSKGRFGNTLSHAVVLEEEELDCYPCALYGEETFRDKMEFEEVNSDTRPELLPAPEFVLSEDMSIENIVDFIGSDDDCDRVPYLIQMVAAVLKYATEKKRIIICDEQENIVKWFAAVHYAFPLEIARKIWFSTYVYNPEVTDTPLCGVVSEGSKYEVASYCNNKSFYVYDFINDVVAAGDEQDIFLDFLYTVYAYGSSSLETFKNFVIQKTTFREVSEEYYDAYRFFRLATESMDKIKMEDFGRAVAFSDRYATLACKVEIVNRWVNNPETFECLGTNYDYIFDLLTYMLQVYAELKDDTKESIKQCVIDRLFTMLADQDITENQFKARYEQIKKCAKSVGLSIPSELAKEKNRKRLNDLKEKGVESWKSHITLTTITGHVIDQEISFQEIEKEKPEGELHFEVVSALLREKTLSELEELIPKLLECYNGYPKYLLYFTFIIEEALQTNKEITFQEAHEVVWNCFAEVIKDGTFENIKWINEELSQKKRNDELFIIYQARMQNQVNYGVKRNVFKEAYETIFEKNEDYANTYRKAVIKEFMQVYLDEYEKMENEKRRTYALELLGILTKEKYFTDDTKRVCDTLEPYYNYMEQEEEHREVVHDLLAYYIACEKLIEGKLELAVMENQFKGVTTNKRMDEKIEILKRVATLGGADVMLVGELAEREKYYKVIYADLLDCKMTEKEFSSIHSLFNLEDDRAKEYYAYVAKLVLKRSKKDEDNLADYILSVLDNNSREVFEAIGSNLCSIGDSKLDDLDQAIKRSLKKVEDDDVRKKKLKNWNVIYDKAEATNPVLKGITGLFGRNK